MTRKTREDFRQGTSSAKLVVVLHGWWDTAASMDALDRAVEKLMPDADRYVPDLPIHSFLSRTRAMNLAESLCAELDRRIAARQQRVDGEGYREIVLIGHSFGAVLVRAIWARAHGAALDGALPIGAAKPWAHCIKRLVLLAGTSRGWDPNSPVSAKIRVWSWFGDVIENLLGPNFLLLDIRRGAPFLTAVRLQTLEVRKTLVARNEAFPTTVNILGTFDNLVAPADNVDLATDDKSHHYLEVPNAGHEGVVQLDDQRHGKDRFEAFRMALIGDEEVLRTNKFAVSLAAIQEMVQEVQNEPGPLGSSASQEDEAKVVKTVIFIVHGIRDYGFWTRRLARTLKEQAGAARHTVHTITASYGFFPMGPFLAPAARRRRVGWLMDQYVTARSLYPEAECHFVGHSNGTYLLAAALKDCRAIRFARVVLAGSVVSRRYDWSRLISQKPNVGQVQKVLNYIASNDRVVATIPKGLQDLRLSDLGDAGNSGFAQTDGVVQVRYVPGSHSAALDSSRWTEIASFVLDGTEPPTSPNDAGGSRHPPLVGQQNSWLCRISRIAFVFPLAAAGAILAGAFFLLAPLGAVTAGWAWALALLLYAWIVGRIVTRL